MNKKILIYGAGAIGRGFLPWVFDPQQYDLYYVEKNKEIRDQMNKIKQYISYRTLDEKLDGRTVNIKQCYDVGEEIKTNVAFDVVITAIGPRNIISILESLNKLSLPVICCENDYSIPGFINSVLRKELAVFSIPDVITSNTAPDNIINLNPLNVITENGVCFINKIVSWLGGDCEYIEEEELHKQWLAKLYIHNTSHCIAAYMGSIIKLKYLHESMLNKFIDQTVNGAMHEMKNMIIRKFDLEEKFVNWYVEKELERFRNKLLFDPIERVAREPFRKLKPNDRLLGAAQLALSCGIIPKNILIGIMSAFLYDNPRDPDSNIKYLINSLEPKDFLNIAMNLHPSEALYELLIDNWEQNKSLIEELRNGL